MTRNTQRRVEIACPVIDPAVRRQIKHYVELFCADNVKARNLCVDGTYAPVARPEDAPALDAQATLMAEALQEASSTQAAPAPQEHRPGLLGRLLGKLRGE